MCEADFVAVIAKLKRNVAPFNITEVAHPAHDSRNGSLSRVPARTYPTTRGSCRAAHATDEGNAIGQRLASRRVAVVNTPPPA
jgi:hypothetical protein